MQMHADLDRVISFAYRRHGLCDLFGRSQPHRVRQRDLLHARFGKQIAGANHLVDAPRIAIGIPEGHREIGNHFQSRSICQRSYRMECIQRLIRSLLLIAQEKLGRDRIRKAQRLYRTRIDGPLSALLIHHDADHLYAARRHQVLEHLLRICHLRNRGGRDETDRIDLREPRGYQHAQIVRLHLGRNLRR